MASLRFGALAGALGLAACGGLGGGPGVGGLEPPPGMLPADTSASSALLGGAGFSVREPSLDWGVGVLRLGDLTGIELPLFDGPRGRHWGWITQGAVYDQSARRTTPGLADASVSVAGRPALLVLEARDDGWLQVRYGGPDDRDDGLAWTHAELAREENASFVRWARALEDARGLVYRNSVAAHNLRADPNTQAAIVERLEGANFDMAALEIRGDWMRVRVSSPPACAGGVAEDLLLGGSETREVTGWVVWRSDDRGPWVESAAGPRCRGGV